MKIRAVIFDLDGTLLDTLDDLTAAVNHALGAFGMAGLSVERVRRYVGDGVRRLIERAVRFASTGEEPGLEIERNAEEKALVNACLAVFTEYYDAHNADNTAPYDGIAEMLAETSRAGLRSAIVTNKYDAAANELRKKFFGTVDVAVGLREGIRPKPAPDGVYKALELIGEDVAHAVYVGDGETDIATAKNCGMPVIAVAWGFRDRAVLQSLAPNCIIDAPNELLDALEKTGGSIT